MKKTITFLIIALSIVFHLNAQIFEDFESLTDYDGIQKINGWVNYKEVGTKEWVCRTFQSNKYPQMTSFNSKEANTAWLITPGVNLDNSENESLEFDVNVGYYTHDGLTVHYSTNFDGTEAGVLKATWTDITSSFTIPKIPTGAYGKLASAGKYDLSKITGTIYVAFKYTGDETSKKTTTYQIDNVKVGAPGTDIVTFSLKDQVTNGTTYDRTNRIIEVLVNPWADLSSMVPTFTVSKNAVSSPVSGVSQNFTDTVVYTVTSEVASVSKQWKVKVKKMSDVPTQIKDVQFVAEPSKSDVSAFNNKPVYIAGVVTGTGLSSTTNIYYVQDAATMWSGIYVYDGRKLGTILASGDSVKIVGKVQEYFNVTELVPDTIIKVAGRKALPKAMEVTGELTEEYEGMRVIVKNVKITNDDDESDTKKEFVATLGNGKKVKIAKLLFSDVAPDTSKYNVSGIVDFSYSKFRLCPTKSADIEKLTTTTAVNDLDWDDQFNVFPVPAKDFITIQGRSLNENIEIVNQLGQVVLNTSASNNVINISELSSGIYFVRSGAATSRFIKN